MPGSRSALSIRWEVSLGLLALAFLCLALIAQHGMGLQPCAWCVWQRFLMLVGCLLCCASAIAGVASKHLAWLRAAFSGAAGVAFGAGDWAAQTQMSSVHKLDAGCAFSAAADWIAALRLESLWPAVFEVRAQCTDSVAQFLGIGFPAWSQAAFILLAIGCVLVCKSTIVTIFQVRLERRRALRPVPPVQPADSSATGPEAA